MSNIEEFIDLISYAPIDVRRAFSKVRELANLEKKYEETLESTQNLVFKVKSVDSSGENGQFIIQLKEQIQRNHLQLLALHRERIAALEIIQQNYQKYIATLDIEGEKFLEELKQLPREQEDISRKSQRDVKVEPPVMVQKSDKVKKTKRPLQDEQVEEAQQHTYCVCLQPSYGTMVACDSKNCQIEWFHLSCVGLTDVPDEKTKWFCPHCRMMR
ncbi:unnamed protein product [Paramecium primaurelia]|uniref:PHD-type domain-containing protein n=1 Tax=Paramecium primaurelia TaxID=5886 RepID=A0A8S1PQ80_PARPR|nr:unnamed protein product [Paramecium primaurelia]